VAWRKRNVFRRIVTKVNCGPRSTLTAAGIMNTRHARVTWPKEKFVREDCTRNQRQQETQKRRKEEEGMWKFPKCKNGLRNQGLSKQLRGETGIKNPGARQQLRPGIEKMLYEILRRRIARQVVGTSSGLRKLRKWTLWRGRPPPKRKKSRVRGKSRAMWDHRPLHEL
jgi:hypothetical protein